MYFSHPQGAPRIPDMYVALAPHRVHGIAMTAYIIQQSALLFSAPGVQHLRPIVHSHEGLSD